MFPSLQEEIISRLGAIFAMLRNILNIAKMFLYLNKWKLDDTV